MDRCRGCGVTIEFVRTESGALMPVQRIPAVYKVVPDANAELRARRVEISDHTGGLWVSHFATCPAAERFSRRKG